MYFEDFDDEDDLQKIVEGRDYESYKQEEEELMNLQESVNRKNVKTVVEKEVTTTRQSNDDDSSEEEEDEEYTGDQRKQRDDEAVEVPVRTVKPRVQRLVMNPRPKLDVQKLKSERGIIAVPKLFENVKFKGKGYEKEDLNRLMMGMEHWANRLMPSLAFDDFIEKCETLGHKRQIQTFMTKIRLGLPLDVISENKEIDEDHESEMQDNDFENMETERMDAEAAFDKIMADDLQKEKTQTKPKPSLTEEQLKLIEEKRLNAIKLRQKMTQVNANDGISFNENVNEDSNGPVGVEAPEANSTENLCSDNSNEIQSNLQ
ncbi:TIMELESS-interacting protein-like isoform X1 [Leptotrombidium deliense]|uniref:TIMELESS-interacting protein n=1 Tax=Leptotrombidium deliense TaxID=299467 RepID=A0A443SST7_9ACAR|nr:TIMELESS-interacting protein-like isoform X1 [Leptotrombidium deliense]